MEEARIGGQSWIGGPLDLGQRKAQAATDGKLGSEMGALGWKIGRTLREPEKHPDAKEVSCTR